MHVVVWKLPEEMDSGYITISQWPADKWKKQRSMRFNKSGSKVIRLETKRGGQRRVVYEERTWDTYMRASPIIQRRVIFSRDELEALSGLVNISVGKWKALASSSASPIEVGNSCISFRAEETIHHRKRTPKLVVTLVRKSSDGTEEVHIEMSKCHIRKINYLLKAQTHKKM